MLCLQLNISALNNQLGVETKKPNQTKLWESVTYGKVTLELPVV